MQYFLVPRTDRQICAVILKQLYIVYDGMLQSLFLYFWPKQEISTDICFFKLVEVRLQDQDIRKPVKENVISFMIQYGQVIKICLKLIHCLKMTL